MTFYKVGGYDQKIHSNGDVTCDCTWSSLHPGNFLEGLKVCWHISKVIKMKKGYTLVKGLLEHRIVVEEFIGRKLTKEEKVHHIDENKQNNNIDNLMLFSNDSEHIKFHNKVRQFGFTNPIKKQIKERWVTFK